MKKICLLIGLMIQILPTICWSQSLVSMRKDSAKTAVTASSFSDYFPISEVVIREGYPAYDMVFDGAMEQFSKVGNFSVQYNAEKDYRKVLMNIRQGKTDILLGMYHDTKIYRGIEYIYPAILNNPVYLIVAPHNQHLISSSEDLIKYKGTYAEEEHFSDYMLNNFKNNKITASPTSFEAYKKLLTGEVDYIIGSYYYNYAKVCELGLKNYVSFSQSALWNMPLFLGVSKASKNYKKIGSILKKLATDDKFSASINEALKSKVKEAEIKYQGVVPPSFVREAKPGELTPADEMEKSKAGTAKE